MRTHESAAGAALTRIAADVRAREHDRLADVMDEQEARLDLVALGLSVDRHLDLVFHEWTSWGCDLGAREGKTVRGPCQRPASARHQRFLSRRSFEPSRQRPSTLSRFESRSYASRRIRRSRTSVSEASPSITMSLRA